MDVGFNPPQNQAVFMAQGKARSFDLQSGHSTLDEKKPFTLATA